MLEKSNKPKKKLQRKVDWEVEAIKGKYSRVQGPSGSRTVS